MKAHVMPASWWNQQFLGIPKHETVCQRIASKEDGPVDYIITRAHRGEWEDDVYRLYKTKGVKLPGRPQELEYTKKQSTNPKVLSAWAFAQS